MVLLNTWAACFGKCAAENKSNFFKDDVKLLIMKCISYFDYLLALTDVK
jgi:hypothetical protein